MQRNMDQVPSNCNNEGIVKKFWQNQASEELAFSEKSNRAAMEKDPARSRIFIADEFAVKNAILSNTGLSRQSIIDYNIANLLTQILIRQGNLMSL